MTEYEILETLQSFVDRPVLFSLVIIATTLVLEDFATASAAIIASQTDIHFMVPLFALFFGITLGDIGLYVMGKYAGRIGFIARMKDGEKVQKAKAALEKNMVLAIVTSRMVPGMRLPTYSAIGALGLPFRKFALVAVVAVMVWTALLFSLFYMLGDLARDVEGAVKWGVFAVVILAVVLGPKIYQRFSR